MRTSLFLVMISSLVAQIEERSFEERLKESLTNVESLFLQSSSSPIFGASKEKGQLFIGEKGQFRMDYDSGISITSDGNTIVQYDPSTRTATRSVVSANLRSHGLWSIVYGQESNGKNFMRQYYDVYCLLGNEEVVKFIGTPEYLKHKEKRFPKVDFEVPIKENEAFILSSKEIRNAYESRYKKTAALYYQGQPTFEELILRINKYSEIL